MGRDGEHIADLEPTCSDHLIGGEGLAVDLQEFGETAIAAVVIEDRGVVGYYKQMTALRDAAKVRGWYVTSDTIRYNESPTAALVAANID
jgi:hypothetical protein